MLRNPIRLLALVLVCGTASATARAGEPEKTGKKQDPPVPARADSSRPPTAEPQKTGKKRTTLLDVRTDPPGATVYLNGKELGTTNGLFPVEPGSGTILLELEGHQAYQRQVMVRANGTTRVNLKLAPQAKGGAAGHAVEQPATAKKVKFVPMPVGPPDAAGEMKFFLGPRAFAKGDNIDIQEVRSERGTLTTGDRVTVKGTYTLSSRPAAMLSFGVTADARDPQGPFQTQIQAGTVPFEIKQPIITDGHLHLGFYPARGGSGFGTIYFGTEAQMKEIANWNAASLIGEGKPKK